MHLASLHIVMAQVKNYNIIVFIFKKTTLQIVSRNFSQSSDILLSSYLLFCLLSYLLFCLLNWLCKYVASNLIWESTHVHMAVWYSARQMVLKSSPYSLNNLSFCFSFTPSHKMQKNIPFWAKYCPMHISPIWWFYSYL